MKALKRRHKPRLKFSQTGADSAKTRSATKALITSRRSAIASACCSVNARSRANADRSMKCGGISSNAARAFSGSPMLCACNCASRSAVRRLRAGARKSRNFPPPMVRCAVVSRRTKRSPTAAAIGRSSTSCTGASPPGGIGASPSSTIRAPTSSRRDAGAPASTE